MKSKRVKPWLSYVCTLAVLVVSAAGATPASAAATWTVTKAADTNDSTCNSDCSLREAVYNARSGDTIEFAPALAGQSINVNTMGPMALNYPVTIDGSSLATPVIVNGNGATNIFILTYAGTFTFRGLNLENGYAGSTSVGGALYVAGNGTTVILEQVILRGNRAPGGAGGALFMVSGTTVNVNNSSFIDNGRGPGSTTGGAIYNNGGTLTVTNSTFSGNSVGYTPPGGALYNGGTAVLVNSTFTGNVSGGNYGAAIYNSGGIFITNSTLSGNTGFGSFYNGNYAVVYNTIIANTASGPDCYGNPFSGNSNNLIESMSGCSAPMTGADPQLGALADNGGPTQTMALTGSSPAANTGNDSICAAAVGGPNYGAGGKDQRGTLRPQGAQCDLGAYEYVPVPLTVTKTADTNDGACNADCSLREAITAAGAGDTILFAPALSGQTIALAGLLNLNKPLTIDASSLASPVTVNGTNSTNIFLITTSGTFTFKGLNIINGYAGTTGYGGGIFIGSGGVTLNVEAVTFTGNRSSSNMGGALYIPAAGGLTVNINNSSFIDNGRGPLATNGGAIYNGGATLNITNSTFTGNSAGYNPAGGALYNAGTAVVTNSTFAANGGNGTAGGAILNGNMISIINSTFSGNTGSGAFYNGGNARVVNSIFANTVNGPDCIGNGFFANVNNLIESISGCSTPMTGADPQLGALADNGGPTRTMALPAGSPAIDAGNDGACAAAVGSPIYGAGGKDQRGILRPQGVHCDLGAYEADAAPADTTAPVVDTFSIASPSGSLIIPIAAFTASDNVGVTRYMVTASSTQPEAGDPRWSATPPSALNVGTEGSYTFYPWAKDAAGNVSAVYASPAAVLVDLTAPETAIDAQPPDPDTDTTPEFSFSGDDGAGSGLASYQCRLDGGDYAGCTSPFTSEALTDGSHTFYVYAIDNASHADATPDSHTWTVDANSPTVTINNGPSTPTRATTAAFEFTSDDGAGTGVLITECSLDGGGWTACDTPAAHGYAGPLDDGEHIFLVQVTDGVGHSGSDSYTWTVDATASTITIVTHPQAVSSSDAADFTFTADDGGGTGIASIECDLNGAGFAACDGPGVQGYTGLEDGENVFTVRVTDNVSNTSSDSYTWMVDTSAPDTSIDTTPSDLTSSTAAVFTFSGDDGAGSGIASFECRMDGGGYAACTSGFDFGPLGDGLHTFYVYAIDNAGNTDPSPDAHSWTIDTQAPSAPAVTVPALYTNDPTPAMEGTAEADSRINISYWDGADWIPVCQDVLVNGLGLWTCDSSVTLPEAYIELVLNATDGAGNTGPDAVHPFTVDLTAPGAPDVTAPDLTNDVTPVFTGTAEANSLIDASYWYGTGWVQVCQDVTVNGLGEWTCESPASVPEGDRELVAHATDAAGNISPDTVHPFTVDLTAPAAPAVTAPPAFTNDATPAIEGTAEADSRIDASYWDGADWIPVCQDVLVDGLGDWLCESSVTLPEGGVQFSVHASDPAGNQGPDTTHDFILDLTAPRVNSIVRASANPTSAAGVNFTVTFSESVANVSNNDFTLDVTGAVSGVTIGTITGLDETWTVTVNTGTGTGTLAMDVPVTSDITDPAGNSLADLPFLDSQTYDIYKGTGVDVSIGAFMGNYDLTPTNTMIVNYPAVLNGPVDVLSMDASPIFTSQRVTSSGSYNELMGVPPSEFTTEYWFPWYDHGYPAVPGSRMRTWILVGNPDDTQTADVDIYIGGNLMGSYDILPGSRITPRWVGLQDGPVRVVSDIPVFASERVFTAPDNSFNETFGYPADQFTTEYWFPWYDSVSMNASILVGNSSATLTADVDIYIGPNYMGNYDILPNETLIQSYPATVNGPVRVVAVNGVDIVASEAALSGPVGSFTAYNEVMGYPFDQFATEYWFPRYDHGYPVVSGSNMRTWILVGNPDESLTAHVDVYIDGTFMGNFTVLPNSRITPRWVGQQGGPVRVVSDIPVFVSERVFTAPGNVFNEMMGYPGTRLGMEYWFPWYDSVNMTNDILIAKP